MLTGEIRILGLQQQTALALAIAHVPREVPAVRRDWRRRMAAECKRYHEVLAARAARAKELATQCRRQGPCAHVRTCGLALNGGRSWRQVRPLSAAMAR